MYKLAIVLLFLSCNALGKEARTKIAIIDTGVVMDPFFEKYLCENGLQDFTDTTPVDTNGHGTIVTYTVINGLNPNEYCFYSLKFYDKDEPRSKDNEITALKYLLKLNVSYLNMSLNGPSELPSERSYLAQLISLGVKVVVAAGNEGKDLQKNCLFYPACYSFPYNFYVLGSLDQYDNKAASSNYNGPVTHYEHGQMCYGSKCKFGTSGAVPNFLNRLIKEGL